MKKCIALEGGSGFFNSTGKVGLCCNDFSHDSNIFRQDTTIFDYNSRKEFLKSKSLTWDDFDFCNFCKKNEEYGYKSTREILNARPGDFELTLSVGNVCNLRCVMCRPDLSYLLSQDISALPDELINEFTVKQAKKISLNDENRKDIENFISTIDKEIYLNVVGGEPLSEDTNVEWFLHLLNNFSNIVKLQITTNLTYNTKKTLKLAENNKVSIAASIEGFEDSYEWTRFGVKWETVLKNLMYFKDVVGHRLYVHSTMHAVSILGDKNLTALLEENKIRHNKALLFSPEWLQLKVLNQKEREVLSLENIQDYDEKLRKMFESYMLSLEKTRKQEIPKSIVDFFGINRPI